jgi:GAF domain-containing protein
MTATDLSPENAALLARIKERAMEAPTLVELQQSIAELLAHSFPHYNWTGFYMLDPNDPEVLLRGAYVGEEAHLRILITEGICGAAVVLGETIIVDDVNADPRYLSCSIQTESEIVVPIFVHGKVAGEIDIDSHALAAFTEADRIFLEEVARIVGSFIEWHSEK